MENRKNFSFCKKLNWLFLKKHRKVKALEPSPSPVAQNVMEKNYNDGGDTNTSTVVTPPINFESPCTILQLPAARDPHFVLPLRVGRRDSNGGAVTKDEALRCARLELWSCGWYWGKLGRTGAQKKLAGKPNGSFLVRDSQTEHTFTLSFRSAGNTLHCRISLDTDMQWSYIENVKSTSVMNLIDETIRRSEKSVFGFVKQNSKTLQAPFPVRLTNPINRFLEVPTLQSLSRVVILRNFTNVEKLPLPPALIKYLSGIDDIANLCEY